MKSAAPLIALDAVALDTETTGLDARRARVLEIGAVRIVKGRFDPAISHFRSLVQPREAIPEAATRIHGITAATVANAPAFAEVWAKAVEYIGDAVVIGHTIDFDLAILNRECKKGGIGFAAPLALDIRLLGQVVEPALADYSLESLAAWLNIEISGRHSAIGDATAAALIFCALVPRLRARGVRTLGEALESCRVMADPGDELPRRAMWRGDENRSELIRQNLPARLDAHPYQKRVAEMMTAPPRSIVRSTPVSAALDRLMSAQVSSLFVLPAAPEQDLRPELMGIVTERDILRAVASSGPAALNLPVEQIMSHPLTCISGSAFAYQAMARMNRMKIRHLGVTDDYGLLAGAVSARDLLRLRAEGAAELGDEIDLSEDVHDLARAWGRLAPVSRALIEEGLTARQVAAVISHELAELTRRAAILAERFMKDTGRGDPPCGYVFLVLGSIGRGESLLAMDQDHALVYADGAPGDADAWFEIFARRASDILHDVGVPYCNGGVMAGNRDWRGSVSTWRQRVEGWIGRSDPKDLLSVDIFFDLRAVYGRLDMAEKVRRDALEMVRGQAAFAKLLVEAGGAPQPARNWYGGLHTVQGRIDLKRAGLFAIVSRARALAVCFHVTERSTVARLEAIKAIRADSDIDFLIDAHEVFLELILKQQLIDIQEGRRASNSVSVAALSRRDRKRLDAALKSVERIDQVARDLLFSS